MSNALNPFNPVHHMLREMGLTMDKEQPYARSVEEKLDEILSILKESRSPISLTKDELAGGLRLISGVDTVNTGR